MFSKKTFKNGSVPFKECPFCFDRVSAKSSNCFFLSPITLSCFYFICLCFWNSLSSPFKPGFIPIHPLIYLPTHQLLFPNFKNFKYFFKFQHFYLNFWMSFLAPWLTLLIAIANVSTFLLLHNSDHIFTNSYSSTKNLADPVLL